MVPAIKNFKGNFTRLLHPTITNFASSDLQRAPESPKQMGARGLATGEKPGLKGPATRLLILDQDRVLFLRPAPRVVLLADKTECDRRGITAH